MPDLLARSDEAPAFTGRIDTLKHEIEDLEAQARALIIKQAQAHSALTSIYDEQLTTTGERIAILQRHLAEAEREQQARDTSAAKRAFHSLPDNLEEFWRYESTTINQMLHSIMGQRRLVVRDQQIIGTQDAPPYPQRKERERKTRRTNPKNLLNE